jgi:hypothetical protein
MADDSGGMGFMGVIVGGLLVVVVGVAVLFATGNLGNSNSTTLKVEAPKVTTGAK